MGTGYQLPHVISEDSHLAVSAMFSWCNHPLNNRDEGDCAEGPSLADRDRRDAEGLGGRLILEK